MNKITAFHSAEAPGPVPQTGVTRKSRSATALRGYDEGNDAAMIPDFDPATGYLPSGEHPADWIELEGRFAWNQHRRRLLGGLRRLASALREEGCLLFLIDGSFVTGKEFPGDFDACCDYSGLSPIALTRLRLMGSKEVMKAEYLGEVYAYARQVPCDSRYTFREFFQRDNEDIPKGIVRLNLASVP